MNNPKNELFFRGYLNPQHPWFESYWPSLAHKIVSEPNFLAKLATWLRCADLEPTQPILISAGPDHIRGVVGTTRLAAALLRGQAWPTQIRCVTLNALEPAPWNIITSPKSIKPFVVNRTARQSAVRGWNREVAISRKILETLDLPKHTTDIECIHSLVRALDPQSGPKKI